MTLDEIKKAIGEKLDTAWKDLKSEVDPDKARAYARNLTERLYEHVLEAEAHLLNHVLGNAEATPEPEPEQPSEPSSTPADPADPADTSGSVADAPEEKPAPAAAKQSGKGSKQSS